MSIADDLPAHRLTDRFGEALTTLDRQHLRRRLRPLESGCGPVVRMNGRTFILMASNDYLGLASHPALKRAAIAAIEDYGVGSGASRLVSGTLPPHLELETSLAAFKRAEAALAFGSGYLANIGAIPALLAGEADAVIFADRLCHASLIDGCRLSGADLRIYRHGDLEQLEGALKRRSSRRPALIVTDGVFSMDGDIAPLPDLTALAERYGADLYVDDAHGTGVMGPDGRGTLAHFGLDDRLPFHMGTLGKALGTSGAFLVGRRASIEYLLNRARSFVYTTAPPPETCAAAVAALHLLHAEPERRERLWRNCRRLREGLIQAGFRVPAGMGPIIPVLVGDPERALALAGHLETAGVYAPAIRPPTVPKETSRIRLTVTSEHTADQIDAVLAAFQSAARTLRLT